MDPQKLPNSMPIGSMPNSIAANADSSVKSDISSGVFHFQHGMGVMFGRRPVDTYSTPLLYTRRRQKYSLVAGSMNQEVVGVVTAGDDAQGMNAMIRAAFRTGVFMGCKVKFIRDGFKGMVEGKIEEACWADTSNILGLGGTILGSQKCPEFKNYTTRRTAGLKLIKAGITSVIAIGGDGTIRAARALHADWTQIVKNLYDLRLITRQEALDHKYIRVVCPIASVEQDVGGTDVSVGASTAIHRITEALDNIVMTRTSGNKAFIVEVLGTNSGYLALIAGLAYDVSLIFIPECPPEGDWRQVLKNKMASPTPTSSYAYGGGGGGGGGGGSERAVIIIVSAGAVESQGKPVKVTDIERLLKEQGLDTSVTVLGHIQRGGHPSVMDRFNGTRMGVDAVTCLQQLPPDDKDAICAVGIRDNNVVTLDIDKVIAVTDRIAACIRELNFEEAVRLKGQTFQELVRAYNMIQNLKPATSPLALPGVEPGTPVKVGVVRVGQTGLGVCWLVKSLVAACESKGVQVVGFDNGLEGLARDWSTRLTTETVHDWTVMTTGCLDTSEKTAKSVGLSRIAAGISRNKLSGLVVIGAFEAFSSLYEMWDSRNNDARLCIPMVMVPVTTSNNIPSCDFCIGADTATNEIVDYCEKLKRVAAGRGNTVFVVETTGKDCGYLATMCGLCAGADVTYTRLKTPSLDTLLDDVGVIIKKIQGDQDTEGRLVIKSENANDNYSLDIIRNIFAEEGKGVFHCNKATIGDIQMGCTPTPFDRTLSNTCGLMAAVWVVEQIEDCTQPDGRVFSVSKTSKSVLRQNRCHLSFKPIAELAAETDFEQRSPTYMWWSRLGDLGRVLVRQYVTLADVDSDTSSVVGGGGGGVGGNQGGGGGGGQQQQQQRGGNVHRKSIFAYIEPSETGLDDLKQQHDSSRRPSLVRAFDRTGSLSLGAD